jgi:hypothetical protein
MNISPANEQRNYAAEGRVDDRGAPRDFGWRTDTSLAAILEEIAARAKGHPNGLDVSSA